MKRLITDYTFDPAARTVTFNGYDALDLRGLIIITNVTRNIIIYSYADMESPFSKGLATVFENVVTLSYDTREMKTTDLLQIYYDDIESDKEVKAVALEAIVSDKSTQELLYEILIELKEVNVHLQSITGESINKEDVK